MAFAGVVLIAVGGTGPHADWLGIALGLTAAVLYATGVLVQKVPLGHVDGLTATFWGVAAGVIATVPFAPAAIREVSTALVSDIGAMVFLGIGPTAIAFTTWAYALSRTSAGALTATTLVVPRSSSCCRGSCSPRFRRRCAWSGVCCAWRGLR